MTSGVQAPGGALNVTLNDATTKGAYMPNGSLRVTDVAGNGVTDASGALRIVNTAGQGVYQTRAAVIRFSDAQSDNLTGVYSSDGAIRLNFSDVNNGYITEDGASFYVTEDGSSFYVTEA